MIVVPEGYKLVVDHFTPQQSARFYGPEEGKFAFHVALIRLHDCGQCKTVLEGPWFKGHADTLEEAFMKADRDRLGWLELSKRIGSL